MPQVFSEQALPPDILQRASLAGGEYAWRIQDISDVIAAARKIVSEWIAYAHQAR